MNVSLKELIRVRKWNFTLELLLKRVLHAHAPGTETSPGSLLQQHGLYACFPRCDFTSEIHEVLFCSHKIWYQPGISVVKHCAKSSISCITGSPSGNSPVWLISISKLKAHGMMSGSGFEVVRIQMGAKNKINKNTRGDGITRWHTTKICTWMCAYCGHASLLASAPAHTHKHTLSKKLRVTVLISWLVTSLDLHMKAAF